tara:strand:- start:305 stop:850 length:546 start_codon:yes stop_codon:yes gene_type:complete
MVVDEAILWSSLVLLTAGLSLHRMGPSFQRSRFGSPLALLGVVSFVLLPEKLNEPESEVYASIIALAEWVAPFVLGAILVLRSSSTYGEPSSYGLLLGWALIAISWIIAYPEHVSVSSIDVIGASSSLLGILLGIALVYIGASFFERSVRLESYSDPLSEEEAEVVRTILLRRLGGDGHGD